MAHIVPLGAGFGVTFAAFGPRGVFGADHGNSVLTKSSHFQFGLSNPWLGADYRDTAAVFAKRRIDLMPGEQTQHDYPVIGTNNRSSLPV